MLNGTSQTIADVLQLLEPYGARQSGHEWRSRCPAHNGNDRNLSATHKDGRWLFFCHSNNCAQEDIEKALGIEKPAYQKPGSEAQRFKIKDTTGQVIAVHVRKYENGKKTFSWELPSGKVGLGGIKSADLPLYGSQDAPSFDRSLWVYITEGEKACDALRAQGAQALATVTGASSQHNPGPLECLRGFKVALFPDNDADSKGLHHMQRHAALLQGIAAEVVTLDTSALPPKGDAVEWLDRELFAGKTKQELSEVLKSDQLINLPIIAAEAPKPARPKALLLADFLSLEVPPREQMLAPWLTTKSLNMVHARPGVGKTWFSLGVAYAVASAGKFMKWQAPKARGVLYIDGEMPANLMQERLSRIIDSQEQGATAPFKILCSDVVEGGIPDLSTDEGQAFVEENLDGVELIIIDNLSTLVNSGKENEAESWREMQTYLLDLRRRDFSVLIVHHQGKGGSQRGTSKKEDALDTVVSLRRPDDYQASEGARVEIHFEKARGLFGQDSEPFEARLGFDADDPERLVWEVKSLDAANDIKIIKLHKEGAKDADIARELQIHRSTVGRALKKAKDEGKL